MTTKKSNDFIEYLCILLLSAINLIWIGVMLYTSTSVAINVTSQNIRIKNEELLQHILHYIKMVSILLVFNIVFVLGYRKVKERAIRS